MTPQTEINPRVEPLPRCCNCGRTRSPDWGNKTLRIHRRGPDGAMQSFEAWQCYACTRRLDDLIAARQRKGKP